MKTLTRLLFVISVTFFTSCQTSQDPTEDPRFNGNRKMAKVLDSLNSIADPNTNYFLSGRKAAQMLQESHNYTNPIDIINWETKYCFELLNSGNTDQSIKTLTAMINKYPGGGEKALADPNFKKVFDLLAVAYLRMGENDNCIANHNSASCIVPLKPKAFHKNTKGSLTAIEFYTQILRVYPKDYQSKWLMNIAYMTLGKYPSEVPKEHFIDFAALDENVTGFVPLENLATELGVDVNRLAGAALASPDPVIIFEPILVSFAHDGTRPQRRRWNRNSATATATRPSMARALWLTRRRPPSTSDKNRRNAPDTPPEVARTDFNH